MCHWKAGRAGSPAAGQPGWGRSPDTGLRRPLCIPAGEWGARPAPQAFPAASSPACPLAGATQALSLLGPQARWSRSQLRARRHWTPTALPAPETAASYRRPLAPWGSCQSPVLPSPREEPGGGTSSWASHLLATRPGGAGPLSPDSPEALAGPAAGLGPGWGRPGG